MTRSIVPPAVTALAAVLLLSVPSPATAQFAVVVPPPARPAPVQVIDGDTVPVSPVDSAITATRTDLRAWVDSAALALTVGGDTAAAARPEPVAADSLADSTVRVTAPLPLTPGTPADPPPPTGQAGSGSTLRDGAPAPDTATPLPLLGALGGAMTLAGLALRRRRRR